MTKKGRSFNDYNLKTEIQDCFNETDFVQLIIRFAVLCNVKQNQDESLKISEIADLINISELINNKIAYFSSIQKALRDPARRNELTLFRSHIFEMSRKAFMLRHEGHTAAANAAMLLCKKLNKYSTLYEINRMTPLELRNATETAIDIARVELDNHRGWKRFMLNLLVGVCTLGFGYAIAAYYKHSFFVINPNTKSKKIADQLEKDISLINIMPINGDKL